MGGSNIGPSLRWARLAVLVGVLFVPVSDVPVHADDPLNRFIGRPGSTYPDLVPGVTEADISREVVFDAGAQTWVQDPTTPPRLYFDTWALNVGQVSLELTADTPSDPASTTVSQCVRWQTGRRCRERSVLPTGSVEWNETLRRFDFGGFSLFELRRLGRDGAVDSSEAGLLASREKGSFCFMDERRAAGDAASVPWYAACDPLRMGIQPGWAAVYPRAHTGQNVVLPMGIADGRYALVVTVDPLDRFRESDEANNRIVVVVELSKGASEARIVRGSRPGG